MVCIDQDAGGNSRLGTRKVCHTQKEWDFTAAGPPIEGFGAFDAHGLRS